MDEKEIIALSSAVIALAAFFLAFRADSRAKELAMTQMFLALRSRFLDVYLRLPPVQRPVSEYTDDDKAAVLAYWHHSFDEWYVTTQLSHKHMKKLWKEFYAPAILSGMRHSSYREVLFEIIESEGEFGEYRRGFDKAVKKLWESRRATSDA